MTRILKDWLPPAALRAMRRFSAEVRFLRYESKVVLRANRDLNGAGRGRRAFLIATGPSLKQEDLTLLAGEDCFTLSNFFLHEALDVVRPKMHFFAPYHEPLILENYLGWLREADRRLPEDTTICLGHSSLPLVMEHRLFSGRKVHYLYLEETVPYRKVNLTRPVMTPQSGPLMILPVLLYMGYRTICLLGCDHTELRDFRKEITHFYSKDKEVRVNASDEKAWPDIIASLESSKNVFLQYEYYKKIIAAGNMSQSIVNLSCDTWLDLFPSGTLTGILAGEAPTPRMKR